MNKCIWPLLLSICLMFSVMMFAAGCGTQENGQDQEAWITVDIPEGQLSSELLSEYNKAFQPITKDNNGVTQASEISCFFTSYYDSAKDIDLADFLKYCPLGTAVTDEAEFREVREAAGFELGGDSLNNMPTPIWKYDREAVDKLILKYTGITTEELSCGNYDLKDTVYVESRDAYYNLTSDFGPGSFTAVSGIKQGDQIIMTDSRGATLTIDIKDGYPLIRSFIEDDPKEIAIVNDLLSAYLDSFKEGGERYDSVLKIYLTDYSIDEIDIVDNELKDRLMGSGTFSTATKDAIFANVNYTVTTDNTENNLNYWAPGADTDGNQIHCPRVLYIDIVAGEYQIIEIGSGW